MAAKFKFLEAGEAAVAARGPLAASFGARAMIDLRRKVRRGAKEPLANPTGPSSSRRAIVMTASLQG